MQYDPTNPTVAGLEAARRTSAFLRTLPTVGPGPEGLLVEALSSALRPGVALVRRPAVDTVAGTVTVLLAVVGPDRRIAVVDGSVSSAALALVYGTFDAVYAVRADDLADRSPRVASAIAGSEVRLFTPDGRRALACCAESPAAAAGRRAEDRQPVPIRHARRTVVRPLRLNRPGEWADAFERALEGARLSLSA